MPTPTADACVGIAPTEAMAERFRRKGSNGSFVEAMAAKLLWPTPVADGDRTTNYAQGGTSLGFAARMWRTPQAGEGNGGGQDPEHRKAGGHSVYLRDQVATAEGGGSLNPTWVEWLMGFPPGWTDCAA